MEDLKCHPWRSRKGTLEAACGVAGSMQGRITQGSWTVKNSPYEDMSTFAFGKNLNKILHPLSSEPENVLTLAMGLVDFLL
jgi:hypothetical protein